MAATAAGTVAEALGSAVDAFRAAGVEAPRLDAEVLLAEATGRDRAMLSPPRGRRTLPPRARSERWSAVVCAGRPVAYVLGRCGFRRIDLRCDARALIPRPETELLVDIALELGPESVLDVGIGDRAIAVPSIADEMPGVHRHRRGHFRAGALARGENVVALGRSRSG